MILVLSPISVLSAQDFFREKKCFIDPANFDFAIAVKDEHVIHGVIAMRATGTECSLFHVYTDGTALVGSILYGAAWRAAEALGYRNIKI